jgi:hypothetical protein
VADWATISSMATAGGTLVLAIATFTSIRSANRSARVAERSMLANQRPILIPSREDDPIERVRFGDSVILEVHGHGGSAKVIDDRIYLAMGLRNGGAGLAVIHSWHTATDSGARMERPEDIDGFRRQMRDLYIPAGYSGFWQGAIREPDDPDYPALRAMIERKERIFVDLLYGDHEGGQRTIARFGIGADLQANSQEKPRPRAEALRYWNVDGDDPR